VPPMIVAVVMVLQRLEGCSDREAVERFQFDLRWKYAAGGLGLGRAGARCRRCRRSVSPTRPPNRTCPFLSIRLSTGRAMADRCH
jgi:Transposase domain (DUF772)